MPRRNENRPISLEAYRSFRGGHLPHVRPQKGPDVYTHIGRVAQASKSASSELQRSVSGAISSVRNRLQSAGSTVEKVKPDLSIPIPVTDVFADNKLGFVRSSRKRSESNRRQKIQLAILGTLTAAAIVGTAIERNNTLSSNLQQDQRHVIDTTRATIPTESSDFPTSESERQRLAIVDQLEHKLPEDLKGVASDYKVFYQVTYKEIPRSGIVTTEGDGLTPRTFPWPYVSSSIAETLPLGKENELIQWHYEVFITRVRLNSPKIVSVERWAVNANTDPQGQPWLYKAIEINSDTRGRKVYIAEPARSQPPSPNLPQQNPKDIVV